MYCLISELLKFQRWIYLPPGALLKEIHWPGSYAQYLQSQVHFKALLVLFRDFPYFKFSLMSLEIIKKTLHSKDFRCAFYLLIGLFLLSILLLFFRLFFQFLIPIPLLSLFFLYILVSHCSSFYLYSTCYAHSCCSLLILFITPLILLSWIT